MKPISLILWDFDGTLYEETPAIKEMFAHAACRAVRSQLPKELYRVTTDETVQSLLKKSREDFGVSFTRFALQGLSEPELHKKHHENLDHSLLKPSEKLIDAFVRLEQAGVASAIVTHGHMIWTKKALDRCGLSPFFPENRIVTAEKINYQKKHRGPGAFSAAMEVMGINIDPKTVMFVEDILISIKNLTLRRFFRALYLREQNRAAA